MNKVRENEEKKMQRLKATKIKVERNGWSEQGKKKIRNIVERNQMYKAGYYQKKCKRSGLCGRED